MAKFALFNYNKPGKGVKKNKGDKKYNLILFFQILGRKFWKLVVLNLLFLFINLPVFFGLLGISGKFDIPFNAPASPLYPPLYAVMQHIQSPSVFALWGMHGHQVSAGYAGTVSTVLNWLTLLCLFTFGISNAGIHYVMRNFVKEEASDTGGDFFGAIKKNWKQALIVGILDLVFAFILLYDLIFFYNGSGSFMSLLLFYFSLFITVVYLFMRPYIYTILVTFKLKIFKIIKNSYILALVGFKRNIVSLIFSGLVIFLNYYIFAFLPPAGALIVFFLTFSLLVFIGVYCAYPIIKKYMIDPYYEEHEDERPQIIEEEPVFKDRG